MYLFDVSCFFVAFTFGGDGDLFIDAGTILTILVIFRFCSDFKNTFKVSIFGSFSIDKWISALIVFSKILFAFSSVSWDT